MEDAIKKDPSSFLDLTKGLDAETAIEKFGVGSYITSTSQVVPKAHIGTFMTEVLSKIVGPAFAESVKLTQGARGGTFTFAFQGDLKLLGCNVTDI